MSTENNEQVAVEEVLTTEETEQVEEKELTVEEQYEARIAELQAKLEEEENRYLRLRADYDNSIRRAKLDREAAEKYRSQKLLTDLLPVLDNLERALQAEVTSEDAVSLKTGIEMVQRALIEATEKEGLQVIPAVGVAFDPNIHQAVMQEQSTEVEAGAVVRELQKGFQLKDRVLRPAMVSVNE